MPTFPPIIESLDRSLLLLVNGAHTPVLDTIMWSLTNALTWIGLFIAGTFLSVKFYRKRFWMILLTLALSIGLTDQISSHIIKPVVKRPRPTHNVEIQGQIHCHQYADGSEYRGGSYGFVSSHAANSTTNTIFLFVDIAASAVAGFLFYNETLDVVDLIGFAMILFSLILVGRGSEEKEKEVE